MCEGFEISLPYKNELLPRQTSKSMVAADRSRS